MFGIDKYIWTQHSRMKMRYYRLTESRVKRVIRHPARIEEGVIENAVACMQPAESKKYSEIWVMYMLAGGGNMFLRHDSAVSSGDLARGRRDLRPDCNRDEPSKSRLPLSRKHIAVSLDRNRIKVITAWRYPGRAPERDPIPPEILREIKKNILN